VFDKYRCGVPKIKTEERKPSGSALDAATAADITPPPPPKVSPEGLRPSAFMVLEFSDVIGVKYNSGRAQALRFLRLMQPRLPIYSPPPPKVLPEGLRPAAFIRSSRSFLQCIQTLWPTS
jgi:hypothetical protein